MLLIVFPASTNIALSVALLSVDEFVVSWVEAASVLLMHAARFRRFGHHNDFEFHTEFVAEKRRGNIRVTNPFKVGRQEQMIPTLVSALLQIAARGLSQLMSVVLETT